ncbi:MAG: leucyl/phenylalanyl-tRNA--protein transferase [Flavobacteriaceae bacterium]|nr:leucyl/phenylalanyl-tRNA--protein transferase [Flavobacteriaceae bacterium]
MHFLGKNIAFPDVSLANAEGLLAIGGDLSLERLILAYQRGIFPWYEDGEPILWWSPDPRFVLFPNHLKVSKSMRKILKASTFNVTMNQDFEGVIRNCAQSKRQGQAGTWITETMIEAYCNLHERNLAKSVEVWQDDKLVGGFYGVDLNNGMFCGESMFSAVSNSSKLAFISFVQSTNYKLIDCQLHTVHLESLGAVEIPRDKFLTYIS